MSERDGSADNQILSLVVGALAIVLIGMLVMGSAAGELKPYAEGAAAWCEDHDGELHNARVIGEHGGLHCELPNGTSVHMSDVPEEELEAARNRSDSA